MAEKISQFHVPGGAVVPRKLHSRIERVQNVLYLFQEWVEIEEMKITPGSPSPSPLKPVELIWLILED